LPEPATILELRGISKSFPGVVALKDIDFRVVPGEVHVLLGENGAGKSTLIKIVAGTETRDEGEYLFAGEAVRTPTPSALRQIGVSVIHQELSLVRTMTVVDNIFLGRNLRRTTLALRQIGVLDRARMLGACRSLFAELQINVDPLLRVADLSMSEMQLVEIARALAFNSRLILMDEPTTALGPVEKSRLFELIKRLKGRGLGIVFVSHILEDCMAIGDRITVLRDGRRVATLEQGETNVDELVRLMTGRSFAERYPRLASRPGATVLAVDGLTSPGKFADVSFDLRKGEVVGFWGLVGAGRTDVMRALFGLLPVQAGSIKLHGRMARIRTPRRTINDGLFFLTEDRKHFGNLPTLTVRDNILISLINLFDRALSPKVRTRVGVIRHGAARRTADELIRRLQIKTPSSDTPIVNLSGGNQQKTLLARALSVESRIIVLDEPTKGIDAGAKVEFYRMLQSIIEQDMAILLVSSELPEVMALSHRIVVMRSGRVRAFLDRDKTNEEELMQFATI
jgi:ABC-type sugar transport system ATPase subunit